MLGVAEAAEELGVSARRVRQMLADGVLDGERVGRAWIIDREQLRRVAGLRPEVGALEPVIGVGRVGAC